MIISDNQFYWHPLVVDVGYGSYRCFQFICVSFQKQFSAAHSCTQAQSYLLPPPQTKNLTNSHFLLNNRELHRVRRLIIIPHYKSILVYTRWVNPKPLRCSSAPCSLQNFGAKSCLLTIVLPQPNPPHPPPCHPPWSSPPLSLSTLSNCRSFRHGLPERLTFVPCISQFSNTRRPPPLLTRNQRGPARRRCLQCNLLSDDRC